MTTAGGTATLSVDGAYATPLDVAIVVFGENPYAEWDGNVRSIDFQGDEGAAAAMVKRFKDAHIPVVAVLLTGRPLWINPELNASDVFVVAWLPGSEREGIAEVIFRNERGEPARDLVGKLSYSWPRHANQTTLNRNDANYDALFPYGCGLTYADKDSLGDALPVTAVR